MSVSDSAARLAVAAAVTLLPASLRDRYREQWHADLRDAPDAGVKRSEIAWGSLAFAVTVDRVSIESERVQAAAVVRKRERLASGLALGAAVVALTHVGTVAGFSWGVQFGVLSFVLAFTSLLLASYLVLAPLAAVVMVTFTRGARPTVRWAVWLLVLSSAGHLVQVLVDRGGATDNIYASPGMAVYGVSALLTGVAIVLLVRAFHTPSVALRRRPVAAVVGAALVFGAVTVGLDNLRALLGLQRVANAEFVADTFVPTALMGLDELEAGLRAAEFASETAVTVWATFAFAAVVALGIVGLVRGSSLIGAVARPAAVVCVLLVAHAAVTIYVQLLSMGSFGIYLPIPDVLLLAGRCGLVLLSLATVGGLRLRLRRSGAELSPSVVTES